MIRNFFKVVKTSTPKKFLMKSTYSMKNIIQISYPVYFSTLNDNPNTITILEEVEDKVFQILKSAAKCNQAKLSRTATFEELGFDSLDTVELVVGMEENFNVEIKDDEAEKITNVGEAIAIFNKYLVEKYNQNKLAEIQEEKDIDVKKDNK